MVLSCDAGERREGEMERVGGWDGEQECRRAGAHVHKRERSAHTSSAINVRGPPSQFLICVR